MSVAGSGTQTPGLEAVDLPTLRFMAQKVAQVHGPNHPPAVALGEIVARLCDSAEAFRKAKTPANAAPLPALLASVRELTDAFTPWEGACGTVRRLYTGLAELDAAIKPELG